MLNTMGRKGLWGLWTALILIILLTAAALACSSCGTQESEPETVFSLSPELQQELEEILDDVMSENGIPGAVIGVWVPGEGSWVEAKGLADVQTGEAMDTADKVRIGSITKTFNATVILQLVDEGRIGLDDPLRDYAPEVPGSEEITVRMLLDHTSGLFDYTSDEDFQEAVDAEPLRKWQPQELVDFAISHEPYFAPGEEWHYSNTNYILLGMIVEEVTGNLVGDEMRTRIYERLGLSNTSFGLPKRKLINLAMLAQGVINGMDAAITDPCVPGIMAAIYAAEVVAGKDDFCMNYMMAEREGKLV